MPQQTDASTPASPPTCTTCNRRPAAGTWKGRPTCKTCHGRALDALAPRVDDRTRTASTQPYRTTTAAHQTARRLDAEPITPHPPTAQVRVYTNDGKTATLYPLADVLSTRTRATLAAIEKGGRRA